MHLQLLPVSWAELVDEPCGYPVDWSRSRQERVQPWGAFGIQCRIMLNLILDYVKSNI